MVFTAELLAGEDLLRAGPTHWKLFVSLFHSLWDYQSFWWWCVGWLILDTLFRGDAILREPWVAGLFHLLHDSFCYFTALFPNDSIIRLIRCFCFKKEHSCTVKSDVWAIWTKFRLLLDSISFSVIALQFWFDVNRHSLRARTASAEKEKTIPNIFRIQLKRWKVENFCRKIEERLEFHEGSWRHIV